MTLGGYVDQLADVTYGCDYDKVGCLLDYLERWEAAQPQPQANTKQKAVATVLQVTYATKIEDRETLKADLPDFYAKSPAEAHAEQRLVDEALDELVMKHQTEPTPVRFDYPMLNQSYLYQKWYRVFMRSGRIPEQHDLTDLAIGWMLMMFHVADLDELAMVFGFGDFLPPERRNPQREAYLKYRGFFYSYDQRVVRQKHDMLVARFVEAQAEREQRELEALIARCLQNSTHKAQTDVDLLVIQTQDQMEAEEQRRLANEAWQRKLNERARAQREREAQARQEAKRVQVRQVKRTEASQQRQKSGSRSHTEVHGFFSKFMMFIAQINDSFVEDID